MGLETPTRAKSGDEATPPNPKGTPPEGKGKKAPDAGATENDSDVDPVEAEKRRLEDEARANLAKGDDDDDAEPSEEEKAKNPKWVQDRLDKLTKQKYDLKSKLDESEKVRLAKEQEASEAKATLAEIAARPPVTAEQAQSSPLAMAWTPEDVTAHAQHAQRVFAVLENDTGDDRVVTVDNQPYELTEAAAEKAWKQGIIAEPTRDLLVKAWRQTMLGRITEAPKRTQWLEQRKTESEKAAKVLPSIHDVKSPEHAERNKLLREIPGLSQRPDFDVLIADMLRGRAMRQKESEGVIFHEIDPKKFKRAADGTFTTTNGHGTNGNGNGASSKNKLTLPPITSSSRAPARQQADPKQSVLTQARSKIGVSLEAMQDSGVI